MNEPISTIMTHEVFTLSPEDTLAKVREVLLTKRFHHLPVVKGKKLVGIITSYDLTKLAGEVGEYDRIRVQDVMTTKVATLGPTELIGAAAQVFLEHLFHGLPIVDEDHNLVGIVTTHDILKYQFYKAYPDHRKYW